MNSLKKIVSLLLVMLLASCGTLSTKPDLERLYRSAHLSENNAPIILIPGLMGTTLENDKGEEVWPKSVSNLAFSRFDNLAAGSEDDGIRPAKLFDAIAGVDFYGELINTLEKIGRYEKATLGIPVQNRSKRRYYVFLYDWRKSNFEAVVQLHELMEQIRKDYRDPSLKVDIIAHSNGGLITRYYLHYGPQNASNGKPPTPWQEGGSRVRRVAMLGTPNLGSIVSVSRLYQGFKVGLRTIPPQILSAFATPFEALPSPKASVFVDANGTPQDVDIYDPLLWKSNQWSVFNEDYRKQIRDETKGENADKRLAQMDARFVANLERAKRFVTALAEPLPPMTTEIALFGGDCKLTPGRAVLESGANRQHLAFSSSEVKSRQKNVDYDLLLLQPGDGLVTRESQLARASNLYLNKNLDRDLFPISQTTFFCENHEMLTSNPYFQNNLLYFIFH